MKWFICILVILSNIFVISFASIIPWRSNSIYGYCVNISVKMDPIQKIIFERTLNLPDGGMIGAPEVLQLGQNLIHLIQAKKAIDIGTYTGSSAVAWALAMPKGSEVLTIDIYPGSYNSISRDFIKARPDIYPKIKRHIGLAAQKLDAMLASGEAGKWDFVFIDADKINYPRYYDQSVNLLRPGGVILIDNALWGGSVVKGSGYIKDRNTAAVDETNQKASKDPRVYNYLMNIADGIHVIFKKNTKLGKNT
ncbi:O-methyltransferase, putative [Brugia malayi]|uniref:Bm6504 n=2 Tax=Brugia malayi TaxID=6279 RepID=A0A0H5S3Y2_BRUMA|nr:O-methyltransferase, putative [Brugia malayi]CRZ23171.1 Bm6504 [Brugia malayi]VIO97556.1 O-methyltransferase, putative [Brugia malayi]